MTPAVGGRTPTGVAGQRVGQLGPRVHGGTSTKPRQPSRRHSPIRCPASPGVHEQVRHDVVRAARVERLIAGAAARGLPALDGFVQGSAGRNGPHVADGRPPRRRETPGPVSSAKKDRAGQAGGLRLETGGFQPERLPAPITVREMRRRR